MANRGETNVRGPKSEPTSEKRLKGNPRRPKPGEEAEPLVLTELPDPPPWLSKDGIIEWFRVGQTLINNRLLTDADITTFAVYCQNVSVLITAAEEISTEGMTIMGARGPVRNPALATFAAATTSVRNMAAEFGMTPSSRARIKLPTNDGPGLEDLLGDEDEDAQ